MNNKVFYQHPNLMRVLGMHETVMEVMVNVLGGDKSQVSLTLLVFLVFLDRYKLSSQSFFNGSYSLKLWELLFPYMSKKLTILTLGEVL